MPPIKSLHDAAQLCKRLAEYYQRRLNRLHGVGSVRPILGEVDRPAAVPRAARNATVHAVEIIVCKAKRDLASNLYRRFHHGRQRHRNGERNRNGAKKR